MKAPETPTQGWINKRVKAGKREMKAIKLANGKVRDHWMEIGRIALEVKDSAPVKGMLTDWATEVLGTATPSILASRAIWMHQHPKAVALVPENANYPDAVVKEWGKIANAKLDEFVEAGRNDLDALAAELGVETTDLLDAKGEPKGRYKKAIKRRDDKLAKLDEEWLDQQTAQAAPDVQQAQEAITPHVGIMNPPVGDTFATIQTWRELQRLRAKLEDELDEAAYRVLAAQRDACDGSMSEADAKAAYEDGQIVCIAAAGCYIADPKSGLSWSTHRRRCGKDHGKAEPFKARYDYFIPQ
ncbi:MULTISPECIES: hypothetical protein [unclassified Ruegeria]|nr:MULTISPECIES: hypothetical protein [unclassified Ruegeria]NOD87889.1 hypothetical protein [Ruegeria sp. HKCCD4318]NOE14259.1 hypothetical protein [Ruegeria sp. HKCCD4318-2]NOG08384.1 hypothetical protein [Ruegeria sp. HKCCD4315]